MGLKVKSRLAQNSKRGWENETTQGTRNALGKGPNTHIRNTCRGRIQKPNRRPCNGTANASGATTPHNSRLSLGSAHRPASASRCPAFAEHSQRRKSDFADSGRGHYSHGPRREGGGGTVVMSPTGAGTRAGKFLRMPESCFASHGACVRTCRGKVPCDRENYRPMFNSVNRFLIRLTPKPLDRGIPK